MSFDKTYTNSPVSQQKVQYSGLISDEDNEISGTWVLVGAAGTFKMRKAIEQKSKEDRVDAKETVTV